MKTLSRITGTAALLAASGLYAQSQPPHPPQPPDPPAIFIMKGGSYLGVGVAELTPDRAKALNVREEHGVEITRVEPDSPAERAGLKTGDVVQEYNNQRVEGLEQFMRLVRETPPGREIRLQVSRSGSLQNIVLKTGTRKIAKGDRMLHIPEMAMPEMAIRELRIPDVPRAFMGWRSTSLGLEAETISGQLAQFFGVQEGVLVRSVTAGSAAEKAGLQAGDVIIRAGDQKVNSPRDITSARLTAKDSRSLQLTVVRNRKDMSVTIPVDFPAGLPQQRKQP